MSNRENNYRHELKYLISDAQMLILRNRVVNIMQSDPNVGENGSYNIRSLYFDDYHNRCFFENENGTDPREKFRVRIYNHSSERIVLECKRKERGKTLKTSSLISANQIQQLMRGAPLENIEQLSPLQRKLNLQMQVNCMKPVVIVEYERFPYIYKNGNVRVTFDTNISSSSDVLNFLEKQISKRPIMPVGLQLMEVKFDEYLPDFIYRNLNLGHLQQTAYSKYYLSRKYRLYK